MKYLMLSTAAFFGLLIADASANAQIVVGARVPGVGVSVGVGGPGYYAPYGYAPYGYAPPAVVYPTPYVAPPVAVGVGVGVGVGPLYRPYYHGGYYHPGYRHFR